MYQHTLIPIAYDALELVNGTIYYGERGGRHYWFREGYPIQEANELPAINQPQWSDEEELLQLPLPKLEPRIISAYRCYLDSGSKGDYNETKKADRIPQDPDEQGVEAQRS